ncbi:MAG: HEAT repeat domain-containing protein [Candidatus Omnitrophica bacterium]|nr:HEAT repeat domain-containing protein [Candidatus Omnitrophota bacterium]
MICFLVFCETSSVVTFGTKSKKIEFIKKILDSKDKVYIKKIGVFLEDEDEEIRSLASRTLYEIGDSTCIDYYKKALIDPYWQVRLYGIKGLVKFGEGDILKELIKSLDDPYWQVRYYSAIGIGKYGDENSIKVLISHLKDSNMKVKESILISLKRLMWKNIARVNFKSLSESELKMVFDCFTGDEQIKLLTIDLFESANDKRCIPYLIKLLEDQSDEVKIKALWTLERFKSENIEEIEGLLNEPSVKVKIEAIKTIVRLKGEEGIEGLINSLEDEDESVKIYALWALEKFKNPVSYPSIVKCISDGSVKVREEAISLIERLKDPLLISVLERYVEDKNTGIESKKIGILLIGKIGNWDAEKAKNILRRYLKSSNREIRYSAIEAFFYLDKFDDYYIKNLVYMEGNDPDLRIRKASSRYLAQIVDALILKIENIKDKERKFAVDKVNNLIGSKEINKLLLKMFYSKYPEIREKSVLILKENPDKIFAKNIKELIKEPNIDLKKLCVVVLGEIKDKNSIDILKQGLTQYDEEYKIICANALAKMGREDGINIILKNIDSENINFQRLAIEALVYLNKIQYSSILLKKLSNAELYIKLISAWGLSRMGNLSGFEVLIRLSEVNVEPIRTIANQYLKDPQIPSNLRGKISSMREEMYREKIGIQEVRPRIVYSYKTDLPIELDGKDNERIWKIIEGTSGFIMIEDERVQLDVQTKVMSVYDKENIYFLFICENPPRGLIGYDSRDFITISLNPKNSFNEWYQFVFHPLLDVKYSYVWKFYKDDEPEKFWSSNWKVATSVLSPGSVRRWIAEIAIPLKDLKIDRIEKGFQWSINFQREIDNYITSTWTGRIDIPEQFGGFIFRESP